MYSLSNSLNQAQGFSLGCPHTDTIVETNAKIPFSHRLALISDAMYEVITLPKLRNSYLDLLFTLGFYHFPPFSQLKIAAIKHMPMLIQHIQNV